MNRLLGAVAMCCAVLMSQCGFGAIPVASEITMTQDAHRKVTITYKLDQTAVVTLDIETNVTGNVWASIGLANVTHAIGDVNRLITVTDASAVHTIHWNPDASWEGHVIDGDRTRAVVRVWAINCPPDWMDISLTASKSVTYYESQDQIPGGIHDKLYKTDHMLMRKIHAAGKSFNKGVTYADRTACVANDSTYYANVQSKLKTHKVSFTNDYYFAIYKVTVRQMFLMSGVSLTEDRKAKLNEPIDECPFPDLDVLSHRGTPTADHYDWPRHGHEVSSTSTLGKFRTLTGVDADFPTDAQWEFACRAGEDRLRYDGADSAKADGLGDLDWYEGNIADSSKPYYPVGAPKKPNAWGIFNLYANGKEWVLDKGQDAYDGTEIEPTGPVGETTGGWASRKVRGSIADDGRRFFSAFCEFTGVPDHKGYACLRFCAPAIAK